MVRAAQPQPPSASFPFYPNNVPTSVIGTKSYAAAVTAAIRLTGETEAPSKRISIYNTIESLGKQKNIEKMLMILKLNGE